MASVFIKGFIMAIEAYEQYDVLTDAEKSYFKLHPHHIKTIKDSKKTAYDETKKRFGFNRRNDKSDAFRHCFWSAILAKDIGYKHALEFTTAHESAPKNDPHEKIMDLHNNAIGVHIGLSKQSNKTLSEYCFNALMAGRLKVLRP